MFLKEVPNLLGVAIYDVNQNCMSKIIKKGIKNINNTTVYKEKLIYDKNFIEFNSGYRIVYLDKDNSYRLGMYAKTLDEFMKKYRLKSNIKQTQFIDKTVFFDAFIYKKTSITGSLLLSVIIFNDK